MYCFKDLKKLGVKKYTDVTMNHETFHLLKFYSSYSFFLFNSICVDCLRLCFHYLCVDWFATPFVRVLRNHALS